MTEYEAEAAVLKFRFILTKYKFIFIRKNFSYNHLKFFQLRNKLIHLLGQDNATQNVIVRKFFFSVSTTITLININQKYVITHNNAEKPYTLC